MYPSLTYRDVRAALQWLSRAFGFEARVFADEGTPETIQAALVYGDGMVMVQCDRPQELHGSHIGRGWVYVAVDDVDGHYERAKAAGAEVLNEPHGSIEGGMRGYSARDVEGNLWSFGTSRPRP